MRPDQPDEDANDSCPELRYVTFTPSGVCILVSQNKILWGPLPPSLDDRLENELDAHSELRCCVFDNVRRRLFFVYKDKLLILNDGGVVKSARKR
jgi:hypothetical protein